MLILAIGDIVWVTFVQVVFGGLILLLGKWIDSRSQARAKINAEKADETSKKVEEAIEMVAAVDTKVDEVKRTTDGIIPKLVAAGKIEAIDEERDRVAAVVEADDKKEAEIVRRVDEAKEDAKAEKVITTANGLPVGGPAGTVAANVEVIKKDVKAVKRGVEDVKKEVTKEVRDGVKQGIEDAKDAEK